MREADMSEVRWLGSSGQLEYRSDTDKSHFSIRMVARIVKACIFDENHQRNYVHQSLDGKGRAAGGGMV